MLVELRYKDKKKLYFLSELELIQKIEHLKSRNIKYFLIGILQRI